MTDVTTRGESGTRKFRQIYMEGIPPAQFVLNIPVIFLFVMKTSWKIFSLRLRRATVSG